MTLNSSSPVAESAKSTAQQSIDRPPRASSGRPKVSVMIITYNHEKYIGQALESVLMQQTDFPFEINVIEDASTDKTQEIVMRYVRQYPDIVKPFFNKQNIGFKVTQKNFYRGFLTLTGDYLAILEGDDYWTSPHKLQKQVDFLDANPEFAVCGHNTIKIYEDGSQEPHRFLYWGQRADATVEDVINLRSFFHTTGILYRNVFNGSPPRQFRNKWSCDIFIMIAHAVHGKVHHIDEDMAVYRAHSGGRFSGMKPAEGWFFNIDGLRHYNAWLGYRYYRSFAESIVRYCEHVLNSHGRDGIAPLTPLQLAKVRIIWSFYRSVLAAIRFPKATELYFRLARQGVLKAGLGPLRATQLNKLPALPDGIHWDLIWGLNAKLRAASEHVPGQPVLLLTAAPAKDAESQMRHAISQRFDGLEPEATYRISIWMKPISVKKLQLHVRDSVVPESGQPGNQGEARFDLSACTVLKVDGLSNVEIAPADKGWVNITADLKCGDGRLFVYLGILRTADDSHAFEAEGEQVLLGGIEVSRSPSG